MDGAFEFGEAVSNGAMACKAGVIYSHGHAIQGSRKVGMSEVDEIYTCPTCGDECDGEYCSYECEAIHLREVLTQKEKALAVAYLRLGEIAKNKESLGGDGFYGQVAEDIISEMSSAQLREDYK